MIKKFELYKESLLNKLEGPNKEEVYKDLGLNDLSPKELFKKSMSHNFYYGMIDAIERGYNPNNFSNILYLIITSSELTDEEQYNILKHIDFNKISQEELDKKITSVVINDNIKTSELLFDNGANPSNVLDEIGEFMGLKRWIKESPEMYELVKKYMNNPVSKPDEKKGFIKKFRKYVGLDESLLNKLEGPTEEEDF